MFEIEDHKQVIEKICRELRVKRLDLVGLASRDDFQAERSNISMTLKLVYIAPPRAGADTLFIIWQ